MTYARKELCEELYSISQWGDTSYKWQGTALGISFIVADERPPYMQAVSSDGPIVKVMLQNLPAYDLGFLRQKFLDELSKGSYSENEYTTLVTRLASALIAGEDRTCQFIINLFKEGKLQKE